MLKTVRNIPALVAINLLALVNAFTGGIFDHILGIDTEARQSR